LVEGSGTVMVEYVYGIKPGLKLRSSHKLLTMRPAPIKRTSDKEPLRKHEQARVFAPLESDLPTALALLQASLTSVLVTRMEGIRPAG